MNTLQTLKAQDLHNNDTFTSMEINIGSKSATDPPSYLGDFFLELEKDTRQAYKFLDLIPYDVSDPNNQIVKVIFTLCVDVLPDKYSEYCEAFLDTDIFPFIIGCGFSVHAYYYTTVIPEGLINLAIAGLGHFGVTIYSKKPGCHIDQILKELFCIQDEVNFQIAENSIIKHGCFTIPKCLHQKDIANFDYIMKKFGLKYEINKK